MAFSPKAAFDYLRRAHEQKRLAHAYLICGQPGSGKRLLAAELANLVNGTRPDDVFAGTADGTFVAEPESKSRRIVIEQVRTLEHALQMRATNGRRKVAILADADRLQPQAANAFLKTLEEPPRDSLLLLLSAMPEMLPETILSRCIAIPLEPAEQRKASAEQVELVRLLRESARVPASTIRDAYALAQGFQRLLVGIRDEIKTEQAEALKREQARYQNTTDGTWLDDREEYYKALSESLYIQRRAALLETLFQWWSDVLRANRGLPMRDLPEAKKETAEVAKRFSAPQILRRIRRLEDLRDHLGRNIQEALAIEVAFLEIFGG
jgi:DNA polymerase III subunit delta'